MNGLVSSKVVVKWEQSQHNLQNDWSVGCSGPCSESRSISVPTRFLQLVFPLRPPPPNPDYRSRVASPTYRLTLPVAVSTVPNGTILSIRPVSIFGALRTNIPSRKTTCKGNKTKGCNHLIIPLHRSAGRQPVGISICYTDSAERALAFLFPCTTVIMYRSFEGRTIKRV